MLFSWPRTLIRLNNAHNITQGYGFMHKDAVLHINEI